MNKEMFFPLAPAGVVSKFLEKIDFSGADGCWLWNGWRNKNGYGLFGGQQFSWLAHRLSYIWSKGLFDIKLTVDHLCKVRNCVNFNHFELVTREENALRSGCPPSINSRLRYCIRGHELAGKNLYKNDFEKRNRRSCVLCHNTRVRKYRKDAKKAKGLPERDQRWEELSGFAKTKAAQTCCKRGHELSGSNLVKYDLEKFNRRKCAKCDSLYKKQLRIRKKQVIDEQMAMESSL